MKSLTCYRSIENKINNQWNNARQINILVDAERKEYSIAYKWKIDISNKKYENEISISSEFI